LLPLEVFGKRFRALIGIRSLQLLRAILDFHERATMKSAILLTSLGLLSAATLAMAAPEGRGMDRLRAADTNGDGMISREEAKALPRLLKNFDALDADKNGQISADEMRAARQARHNAAFDKLDTDKNGVLSREEFNAAHQHPHRAQK
jgi:hypothetical protein